MQVSTWFWLGTALLVLAAAAAVGAFVALGDSVDEIGLLYTAAASLVLAVVFAQAARRAGAHHAALLAEPPR